ncbi:MAG: 2,3-bisphosphoglycerate-independent phosphoglycerate mutase, partial [Symbiobacteriaceae bacterium]|nr:2,3-bisphosphoglycerate-independent phosphoglycerate mutase [Symbiobacteriaceae bacterium]
MNTVQATPPYKPVVLAILDGWGLRHTLVDNAIALGDTPNLDNFYSHYPWCNLVTCGLDVGLVPGQMGDSNVGHLNIGAGRVVYQWLGLLAKAIADGSFAANPVIQGSIAAAQGGCWHLLGLLSDGGVHSHLDHLVELLRLAKVAGQEQVYIHALLDGRDVLPPKSAAKYFRQLEEAIATIGVGCIATVGGRYYTMDRDNRWERVAKGWQAIVNGEGLVASSPLEALEMAYQRGESDEFVTPTVIVPPHREAPKLREGDSLFLFNYRADRVRQISHAFLDDEFTAFSRGEKPRIALATMAEV